MVNRIFAQLIQDTLGKFPAVAILGPRQCGKTTLAGITRRVIRCDEQQEPMNAVLIDQHRLAVRPFQLSGAPDPSLPVKSRVRGPGEGSIKRKPV